MSSPDRTDLAHAGVPQSKVAQANASAWSPLTMLGLMSPVALLLLTFALGIGAALNAPASEAIVPELVPREQLLPAVTLNSAGINIARAIGPAIGGFVVAAVGLLLELLAMFRFRLEAGEAVNLDPSRHWATLSVADEAKHADGLERSPVMVTVEYRIDPAHAEAFRAAMQEVRAERRRDGAIFWGLFVDTDEPERYVEFFTFESWLEHLRQHERVLPPLRLPHKGNEPPAVTAGGGTEAGV